MDTWLKTKLEEFIARGSELVMSGTAALDATSGKFVLEDVPVTLGKKAYCLIQTRQSEI